jgi:hypothetical protein
MGHLAICALRRSSSRPHCVPAYVAVTCAFTRTLAIFHGQGFPKFVNLVPPPFGQRNLIRKADSEEFEGNCQFHKGKMETKTGRFSQMCGLWWMANDLIR